MRCEHFFYSGINSGSDHLSFESLISTSEKVDAVGNLFVSVYVDDFFNSGQTARVKLWRCAVLQTKSARRQL
jgi:hypothetical protein